MVVSDDWVNAGFPPIVAEHAKVLILGTMPGVASLTKQEYYGHPRNAFWPIMAALFAVNATGDYQCRVQSLIAHGIAVWDVIQCCQRAGSLDANINIGSMQVNDFNDFFGRYPSIGQVFFNGGAAEKLYCRYVRPNLDESLQGLHYHRLPSTSPAYATLSLAEKITAWQVLKEAL